MNKPTKAFAAVFSILFIVSLLFLSFPSASEAAQRVVRRRVSPAKKAPSTFAGGAGTQKSPYVIRGAAQLAAFSASVNSGNTYAGKYVKLDADVDLAGTSWLPIGAFDKNSSRPFMGIFDGAGHTIWNLRAGNGQRSSVGLFGSIEKARVSRVYLQYVEVVGDSNVGGLVAFMKHSSVNDCTVSGSVVGTSSVGGIVGSALGSVMRNCGFSGNVKGSNGVGGVVGTMDQTGIQAGVAAGRIGGREDVGGIVGSILAGDLLQCQTDALTVEGEQNIGGIVGHIVDNGDVNKTTFNGQVTGSGNVGGVVGRMMMGELANCAVWGNVRGRTHTGGVAGEIAGGGIADCVSNASVLGVSAVGGIAGYLAGGSVRRSENKGTVKGGEAAGGIVGQLSRGDLAASENKGSVGGYYRVGAMVGMEGEILVPAPVGPNPIPRE
jgi:hypothetical protein